MSEIVYPCRVCRRLLGDDDAVVEVVEVLAAGHGEVVEGHHDFAHLRCIPPGTRHPPTLREVGRGQTLDASLRRLGDR